MERKMMIQTLQAILQPTPPRWFFEFFENGVFDNTSKRWFFEFFENGVFDNTSHEKMLARLPLPHGLRRFKGTSFREGLL
jgi:hypothetical protein